MVEFLFFLSSGLFLGWSLGGNDAANIFGTAVGSKMIRFKSAAIIGSVFVIIGAVVSGAGASGTLGELGAINALGGAFMVALSAAICVFFMSKSGIPVSTSQAIVGGVIGWNFYAHKPTDIMLLSKIATTWIVCPIIAGVVALLLFLIIKQWLKTSKMHLLRQDFYTRIGLVVVGAFGAYALGANNIANVMGVFVNSSPIKGVLGFSSTQVLFLIGAIAIAVGIITYSKKVIETVGNSLMEMSPIVALIVVFSQAFVLFIFSSTDLQDLFISLNIPPLPLVPVSSSQAVVGAIIGIGIAKKSNSIKWSVLGRIAIGWVLTPIISALISFVGLFMLANIFQIIVAY
ncbi:MAG: anion permease [Alphaproteobacteria bacterium]